MELVESGTAPTIYEPLRKDQNEIRLLTLLSVSNSHKRRFAHRTSVSCNLASAALSEHLKYEALSYTWDTDLREEDGEGLTRLIDLNGNLVRIGQNIYDFLVRLQQPHVDRVVWVDALCIYLDRFRTKCCRNLWFEPLFCDGVGFAHLACRIGKFLPSSHIFRRRVALHVLLLKMTTCPCFETVRISLPRG